MPANVTHPDLVRLLPMQLDADRAAAVAALEQQRAEAGERLAAAHAELMRARAAAADANDAAAAAERVAAQLQTRLEAFQEQASQILVNVLECHP